MLGWLVSLFRSLLERKKRDVLRPKPPADPTHAKRSRDSEGLPPIPPAPLVPQEVPGDSVLASEQPVAKASDIHQEAPPLASASSINLSDERSIDSDNVELEPVAIERIDSLLSLTPQAVPSESTASAGAEFVLAAEAFAVDPRIELPVEPEPAEAPADALASIPSAAPEVVPQKDRAAATPTMAEAPASVEPPDVFEGPTPDQAPAPIPSASGDSDHERDADLEAEAVSLQPSRDESVDDLPPDRTVQPRPPSRYRPRLRERPTAAPSASNSSLRGNSGASGHLDADLMLIFQPGGWDIALSLLLRRPDGMPEETAVRIGGEAIRALAIDRTCFEPLPFPDVALALRDGIAIETVGAPRRRWVRTGRPLHLFSERPGIPGFASVARSIIGQENVILCTAEISSAALKLCEATGTDELVEVTGSGVADGWRCFRGYRPRRPASVEAVEEILVALNPLPDAAIELSDGIAVSRGKWIVECPPNIRIVGVEVAEGEVSIDGLTASLDGGRWIATGWDLAGQHTVRYAGLSRSYEIAEVQEDWHEWPAHSAQQFYACGATVAGPAGARSMVLPIPGGWLLGAEPGQISRAVPSPSGFSIASPDFEPVWAIPPRIGRARPVPHLLESKLAPRHVDLLAGPASVREWRRLVLDAPAKLSEPEANRLWQLYRRSARTLPQGRHR